MTMAMGTSDPACRGPLCVSEVAGPPKLTTFFPSTLSLRQRPGQFHAARKG